MTEVIAYTLSVIKGHCGVTAGESSDLSLGRTANSEIVRLAGSQTLSDAFLKVLRAAQPVSNEGLQIAQSEPREPPVVSHLVWKIESAVSGSGVPSLWKTYGAASDNEFIRSPERRGAAGTRAP